MVWRLTGKLVDCRRSEGKIKSKAEQFRFTGQGNSSIGWCLNALLVWAPPNNKDDAMHVPKLQYE